MESLNYIHNAEFESAELLALFDAVGFNRLNEWNLENIQAIFNNTDYYVVAKNHGVLVGFVRLLTDWHTRGYISNLCVVPGFQHQGIGRRLMQEIIAVCDENKILVVNVFDTSSNPEFYAKLGFVRDPAATGLLRIRPDAAAAKPRER